MIATAWYGRVVLAAGTFLTATTGAGLWGFSQSVGESFAWEIRAPLTAAWMGAFYLAAAGALGQGLFQRAWCRTRIVLVVGFTLTTTSLIATIRFLDEFRFGDGAVLEQLVAWVWLVVYIAIPPAVLVVFVLHERRCGPPDRMVEHPLLRSTRGVLGAIALAGATVGIWLTARPATLIEVWPWKLTDLSASIVGTWLITLAVGAAWGLHERDWLRCRIVLWSCLGAFVLLLVALARFEDTLTGDSAAIAAYVAGVSTTLAALLLTGLAQERRAMTRGSPSRVP